MSHEVPLPVPRPDGPSGLEYPGVLDLLVHDTRRGVVILAMFERRTWDGGDHQLWQLQEKLNAYASFLLDGEYAETYPQFASLPVVIQLRTLHEPPPAALELLSRAGEQLAFQEIGLEVWSIAETDSPVEATQSA
jgi:hypothetical protein